MDCLSEQYLVASQFARARAEVIYTIEQPKIICKDGILGIHDRVLGDTLIIISPINVEVCTRKKCDEVGPDFLEKYKTILSRNAA